MKVSLNWLKEFVDIKITPEELANRMALSFVEVDEIIKFDEVYKDVFVGEIKEIKKHPNADNLSVAKVLVGKKRIQIIIGQGLILAVGTKLPIVVAPTELPSGMIIEKRLIRGVESDGMIGANKEIGLDWLPGDITFFDKKIKTGIPIAKALGLNDVVLDLDILSNRPDLFSHLGVAREISAVTGSKLKDYNWGTFKEDTKKAVNDFLSVEIKDKKLCSRYEARIIEDVKIAESPDWLKNRLSALGIRPINNIVDITNYVMVEMGQPMHAYDYNTLHGNKKKNIIVRKAKSGEEMTTLDDKKRRLSKDTLLITDGFRPIGIAGVMGGIDTEVTQKTKTIVLEAANFSWPSIRKTSRLLGLRSEAVNRFEKGLDSNMTSTALDRATYLLSTIANGKVVRGKIDEKHTNNKDKKIEVSLAKISRILGFDIKQSEVKKSLELLGMKAEIKGNFVELLVPSYRMDIKEDVDVIEDVARIIGYDKIPTTVPRGSLIPPKKNESAEKELLVKNILVGLGLSEVYTYSFIGDELLKNFKDNTSNYLELKNPLSPDRAYLRTNLIYSLSECAIENTKNFEELSIFEVSKVFSKNDKAVTESTKIGIAYVDGESFFEAKGIVEALFSYLNIVDYSFDSFKEELSFIHPRKASEIKINNKSVGYIGELHPEVITKYDIKKTVTVCELDFDALLKNAAEKIYVPYSKFPGVLIDIAIVVDERTAEKEIKDSIIKESGKLFNSIELFDIYRGSQIKTGEKSLAYHLSFKSDERTLTEEDISPLVEKILLKLKKEFSANLRG